MAASQGADLERAIKRACNRARLFSELAIVYPNAQAFVDACASSGEAILKVLSEHPDLVKWAILDAVGYGLETDLIEMRKTYHA